MPGSPTSYSGRFCLAFRLVIRRPELLRLLYNSLKSKKFLIAINSIP